MKKIFALMLAAALALSLVACGGGNNAQDSTSAKGSEKTKEETLTVGEFVKEGDWSFTLESVKFEMLRRMRDLAMIIFAVQTQSTKQNALMVVQRVLPQRKQEKFFFFLKEN